MRWAGWGWALSAVLVGWTPTIALACPVCFAADEANRDAFLATTVFMSLFPLAMIGGLLAFLVKRAREADVELASVAPPPPPPIPPTDDTTPAGTPDEIVPTTDGGAPR